MLVVLGLPAVLAVHGTRSPRLTLVGYVGIFAPLVMLNVAETTIEAFVMPYLARHGGIPAQTPAGLNAFEGVALLLLIVGRRLPGDRRVPGADPAAVGRRRADRAPSSARSSSTAARSRSSATTHPRRTFCFGLYAVRPPVGSAAR